MALAINILPLTSGDRLTRREFERRYEAMPENFKAELIEGVVYVASPVRFTSHGAPHTHYHLVRCLLCGNTRREHGR